MKSINVFFHFVSILIISLAFTSCGQKKHKSYDFNQINDRVWIGEEFWSIPIEDWQIKDGRIECVGDRANMRVNLLTTGISGDGSFNFSVQMGVLKRGEGQGSAGIRIAIKDNTDSDYRSLCYFVEGLDIGIRNSEEFFLADEKLLLPETFDQSSFILRVEGQQDNVTRLLSAEIIDTRVNSLQLETSDFKNLDGMISLVSNHFQSGYFPDATYYWFDNISLSGGNVQNYPDRTFGPVLWSMYTLSEEVLKMTAQMPPISSDDPQTVMLQMQNGQNWIDLSSADIDPDARVAVFKVEN